MRKSIWVIALALPAILSPTVLRATDITYNVNESVGASGSVTGFITTDGNTGVLGSSDIVNWNLVLNDGTDPTLTLQGLSNSGERVYGSDLTATGTQLLFNYSGTDSGAFLLQNPGVDTGGPFVCYETDIQCSGFANGISLASESEGVNMVYTALTGNDVIGNASVSATPEPGSLLLLGTGLLGLAGLGWRRFA